MASSRFFACAASAAVLATTATVCHASGLDLHSPVDTSALTVGQTFTVQAELSGISAEQISFLGASVAIAGTGLSAPTSPVSGPIIPNPLSSPSDVTTSTTATSVDYTFLTLSDAAAYRVTSNGILFSFNLTAQKLGQGAIGFTFVNAQSLNPTSGFPTDLELVGGESITYEVTTNGGTSVPEPTSVGFFMAGGVGLLARRRAIKKH